MRSFKIGAICFTVAGLLVLGACSKGEKAADKDSKSTPPSADKAATPPPAEQGKSRPGGITVETNGIHLEVVPEKSADKTHLDLYVEKSANHEPIPIAKVVAQVQTPDGKQQSLDLKYDAEGKHFAAILPGKAAGQYQVKITADVSGKKVDGRFTFNR